MHLGEWIGGKRFIMDSTKDKKRHWTVFKGLAISLAVMLFGLIMSSAIMHNWGTVSVRSVTTKTVTGNTVRMRIFKPDSATADDPAPTIVFVHGWSALPEGYTNYELELARRGFVVIAPDMLAHGDSDVVDVASIMDLTAASDVRGVYAAVRYAKDLDYVDKTQFGIAGHSAGGMVVNGCVLADEADGNMISAVYVMSYNPMYSNDPTQLYYMPNSGGASGFNDAYGARDVGVYYTHYDHAFFFGTDANGTLLRQQDYLQTQEAKSFVSFGDSADTFKDSKVAEGHYYIRNIDGKESIRVIDGADEIHARAQASSRACADLVSFFQTSFKAPNYLSGANQVWKWYYAFSLLGFAGLMMSVAFLVGCLCKTKLFASLAPKNGEVNVIGPAPDKTGKKWFWGLTLFSCAWALISCTLVFATKYDQFASKLLPQQYTNIFAFWNLLNGIMMIVTLFFAFYFLGKRQGATARGWGILLSPADLIKTLAICLIALAGIKVVLVFASNVFTENFQCYMWGLRDLPLSRLKTFLAYLPMYLLFYIALSVSINSAYFNRIAREPEWVNDLFFAFMNMLPALLISVIGYEMFKATGIGPNVFGSTYTYSYLVNAIPCAPIGVLVMRRIHKYCGNPYIPGVIVGVIFCTMQVVGCATLAF